MIWTLAIIVYTVLSIWYFLLITGHTYRKDKWYDYPILFPTFMIIHVSSAVVTVVRWLK